MTRAFILVLDSLGIGGAPDAAAHGDEGADTLGHIAAWRAAPVLVFTISMTCCAVLCTSCEGSAAKAGPTAGTATNIAAAATS